MSGRALCSLCIVLAATAWCVRVAEADVYEYEYWGNLDYVGVEGYDGSGTNPLGISVGALARGRIAFDYDPTDESFDLMSFWAGVIQDDLSTRYFEENMAEYVEQEGTYFSVYPTYEAFNVDASDSVIDWMHIYYAPTAQSWWTVVWKEDLDDDPDLETATLTSEGLTVVLVPEPGTVGLLACLSLTLLRRRSRPGARG